MINNKSLLEKLKFYAQKNKNVLLTGLHGVGKTSIVESVFKSMGWNYLILNGSTMDPYLHLIGIATTVKIEIDGETVDVLKQVLPEVLAQDNIDALFNGNVSEIKSIISEYKELSVQVYLYANDKNYQAIYTRHFERGSNRNMKRWYNFFDGLSTKFDKFVGTEIKEAVVTSSVEESDSSESDIWS